MEQVRLTQYTHGGGCGCKISPAILDEILKHTSASMPYPQLLVGNDKRDDAAVYDIGDGRAIISTTDFFMPIVDDAKAFGKIASANAISDVYAMGGRPLLAIAILGWPVEKLPPALAGQILEGAREVCDEAGIPLAGGHSIDSPEPIFGLAVTGMVELKNLKTNAGAKQGDLIYLTKPLGVGMMASAQKAEKLLPEHAESFIAQLQALNSLGEALGKIEGVHAMTDVTGFGLIGHLSEMAEGSGLTAKLIYNDVPKRAEVPYYLSQKTIPNATSRNWNRYSPGVNFAKGIDVMEAFHLLPDPQTNGGLLIAVDPKDKDVIEQLFNQHGLHKYAKPIGSFVEKTKDIVWVI